MRLNKKTDQYALRQKLAINCVESQAFIKKNKFKNKNSHNQIEQHQINMRSIFKNMHTINNQSALPSHLTHHIN
jgi:broad-specificity NMP kinase